MKTGFFFVYGTLKVGGVFAEHFDIHRLSTEKATLKGMRLYNIGWFPGILHGRGVVVGELHEYKEPDTVMVQMDQIEGYNGGKSSLFNREYKTVITESGKEVKAVVYIYNNKPSPEMKVIENGVWDLNRGRIK